MGVSFIMAGNRYNPLNIDESKIVKKDQSAKNNVSTSQPKPIQQEITSIPPVVQQTSSQVIPNVIQPEIEQEPIQVTETVIDPIDISEEVVIPKQENISEPEKVRKNNKITSKGQNYLDVVNEYIDNEQNVIKDKLPSTQTSMENMLQETYQTPKIPVYTYSKDLKTGKAKIEPKNKKDEQVLTENKEDINFKDTILKQEIKKMIDEVNRNIIRIKIELQVHLELLRNTSDDNRKKLYENKIKAFREDLEYHIQRKSILERM